MNINDNLSKRILEKLEPSLNLMILIGSAVSCLAAIIVLFDEPQSFFIKMDFGLSILLALVYLYRNKLSPIIKITGLIFVLIIFSAYSFIISAYSGSGLILLTIAAFLAIVFLNNISATIVTVLCVACLVEISICVRLGILHFSDKILAYPNQPIMWMVDSMIFFALLMVIFLTIKSLKGFLIEIILELEEKLVSIRKANEELEMRNAEITENQEQIYNMAYYDQLTEIPNRNRFRQHINERIKISPKNATAKLFLIDIKGFKLINSMNSIEVGDEVLKSLAKALTSLPPKNSYVSRLGGNEFGLWFESPTELQITAFMEEFKSHLELSYNKLVNGRKLSFYGSFATFPQDGDNFDLLYQNCSLSLKEAKDNPSLDYVGFSQELYDKHIKAEQLKTRLEKAVNDDEFIMYYQEKVNSSTDEVTGLEALARWESTELGFIGPHDFIPIIENSELNIPFGQLIIKKVLSEIPHLLKIHGNALKVSINISPYHLTSSGFSSFIKDELAVCDVNPTNIMIEITEGIMLGNDEQVILTLTELKQLGIGISMDDFGTGYSSLRYLTELPLNELKIDKSFVDKLLVEKSAGVIVESIVNIAHSYGFSVVAEGVETVYQVEVLKSLGCYTIQGYYYSLPASLSSIIDKYANAEADAKVLL